jgi:hypothetical protein
VDIGVISSFGRGYIDNRVVVWESICIFLKTFYVMD